MHVHVVFTYARVYASCTGMCAGTNFHESFLVVYYYQMSLTLKLYKDPSICYGDIIKMILMFFNNVFSLYFSSFSNNTPLKPSKMDNY